MDNIRQAIERAKARQSTSKPQVLDNLGSPRVRVDSSMTVQDRGAPPIDETELNCAHLLSKRIVSHDRADPRSRPYDMLRTQILQSMSVKGGKVLGVTSPTPECGKTLTAVNLALSIARQPDHSVILVDMDLHKPQIANYLGLRPADRGVVDLLEERTSLRDAAVPVRAGKQRMMVLPSAPAKGSSEMMGSRAMRNLVQDLKRDYEIIIFDLPPMLAGDDVIAALPYIDGVLLVAAVGLTKAAEVEECMRHLQSGQLLRLVLNKATDTTASDYYS
jgi:protein-tyrosine kinase